MCRATCAEFTATGHNAAPLPKRRGMDQSDYQALAAFRLEIRRFMAFSRQFLEAEGLPPAQYQAMLAIQASNAAPYGISDLAAELFIRVQTAVELVARMQESGLVDRQPSRADRRRILLTLTERGRDILPQLAERHLQELHAKAPAFAKALARFSA